MDIPNPTRLRPKKSTPTERFLGAYPHAPPPSSTANLGDELNEDDIFWTNDSSEQTHLSTPPSTSSTSRHTHHIHHHHHHKTFAHAESFGILAALPEREASSSNSSTPRTHSHFYHKASVSSSSSCSPSQLIPTIPKPPQDRSINSSVKYHQSAPVNVPILSNAIRIHCEFDAPNEDVEDDEGDGEMLPPHEMVARSSTQSPMLACSVLEGVGRTLKGRDLRRVRNAVWRRTGFLD